MDVLYLPHNGVCKLYCDVKVGVCKLYCDVKVMVALYIRKKYLVSNVLNFILALYIFYGEADI
jgi:hypothetical protein